MLPQMFLLPLLFPCISGVHTSGYHKAFIGVAFPYVGEGKPCHLRGMEDSKDNGV